MQDESGATPNVMDFHAWPDAQGRFGRYGGRFVAETLMPLILDRVTSGKARS